MTALKALISISRRLERFEGQKNMGAWRSSRAFETLMMRMLGLMAFSTTSGMGLLLLVKRNGDFGARTNPLWRFHLRLPCTCVHDFSFLMPCVHSPIGCGTAGLFSQRINARGIHSVASHSPRHSKQAERPIQKAEHISNVFLPQVKCTQSSFYNCGRTTRTLKICHRVQHNENVPTKRALLFLVGYEDHLRKKVASPGPRREPECDGTCTD